jgi:hypothetical protein
MLVTNFRLKHILYKIICGIYQASDVGRIHPARERALRALHRSVDYIERAMPDALGFDSQRELIEYALKAVAIDGHYLEFGVFTGGTIRFIARCIGNRTIHGFDSFRGLPEAWSGFNLGGKTFDVGGRLPRVPRNVMLHAGYFDTSLPKWLDDHPGQVAFIHLDCDLYSSTKTVLALLAPRLASGTVILFDEYFNYPNWEQHEFKAFQEFVSEHKLSYTYLGFARQQVAVRIESMGAAAATSDSANGSVKAGSVSPSAP